MSGHSHWAGIKHHKGLNDAKRAALFTKYGRNIIIAAEHGGGNPDTNYALKIAIDAARTVNMPKDKIERAIKRGTGELKDEKKIEEYTYEAYGPGQVALLVETATDNKNRTVSELKSLFTKNGGKMGAAGSVMFLFRRVGLIAFSLEQHPSDTLENAALDSGADDFTVEAETFLVITAPDALQKVQQYFQSKGFTPERASLGYMPAQSASLTEKDREHFLKLREIIDDHPDVQTVWDNLA